MPTICMFYGIIIRMMFLDNQQHSLPHIHVEYQGGNAVISIPEGDLLEGQLPGKKLKLIQAWVTIHEEELMADWALAIKGEPIFKIEPLR
uniref:DUF4160 domain-containing protein n=1 Tax=Candidatus Kentrum sp. UNK TaxID=2126344 RepID=A0A451AV75_9GAMM|nr:MAG: protein of unknown function (DUF4160) [Candidatus Kentron sp. UNK]VFK69946.1 MAG: protein of unknown function (DUF4160) [Candidatus Kentron sp. UNK]